MSSHSAACSWRCNCGVNVGPMKENDSPIARNGFALPMLSLYYFVRGAFINSNWVYIRDCFGVLVKDNAKLSEVDTMLSRASHFGEAVDRLGSGDQEPYWVGFEFPFKGTNKDSF